ncbi:biotin/lipoate A/B protein ligase family protein [Paenibacillus solisilvae]|uniref:Biotin/lipoate A/B protein ligase family protein n=1 Tax=Paenibacillus solisilvae TaxID=2486751 RepID=A0ABW0W6A8_9BACL
MGAPWRFVHTGSRSPEENMAIDEAMLIAHSEGRTLPSVRFYGWNPPTLSIGYFQRVHKEIDVSRVMENGIGFVRRATGGRAVLHDQELTYSIIVSESYPGMPANVTDAYRVLSMGLLYGFQKLGLHAEMTGLAAQDSPQQVEKGITSPACFDSPSKYELVLEGKKIAGSAQMRARGMILQHGSVLLDLDTDLLFRLLLFKDVKAREEIKQTFDQKAAAINPCLQSKNGSPVTIREVEEAFRQGFAEGLETEFIVEKLSGYEEELAAKLVREKYGTQEWNFRR